MNILIIMLRIVHIFCGVFWVGGAMINHFVLVRVVKATAPEGARFMGKIMGIGRFSILMTLAAWLTILSGGALIYIDSGGLQWSWFTTGIGVGYGIGALAALGAFLIGAIILGPTGEKIGGLQASFGSDGPSPEQGQQLAVLNARMATFGELNHTLLLISLLGMVIARYLLF